MKSIVEYPLLNATRFFEKSIPIPPNKYQSLAHSYYSSFNWEVKKFDQDMDPLKSIWLDPKKIKYFSGRYRNRPHITYLGSVKGGDWDRNPPPEVSYPEYELPRPRNINEFSMFLSYKNHFENGVDWEDTRWYSYKLEHKDKMNMENIHYYDELYRKIRDYGYQSQFQLGHRNDFLSCILDEILIDIGRNGEMLLVDNKHRLFISKLLDLKEVPVTILTWHKEYFRQ